MNASTVMSFDERPLHGRPRLSRTETLQRVLARVERDEPPIFALSDLHACCGVSPRTLRTMFLDVFGVTPSRYVRLRRMHRLRAELAMADPTLRTVAEICARLHLSDAGRVAHEYRELFDEYPHQTLARRPDERPSRSTTSRPRA